MCQLCSGTVWLLFRISKVQICTAYLLPSMRLNFKCITLTCCIVYCCLWCIYVSKSLIQLPYKTSNNIGQQYFIQCLKWINKPMRRYQQNISTSPQLCEPLYTATRRIWCSGIRTVSHIMVWYHNSIPDNCIRVQFPEGAKLC